MITTVLCYSTTSGSDVTVYDTLCRVDMGNVGEDALLSEWPRLLPITGTDIIRELGIPAGRNVGRALEMARAFYQAGTFGREDLLEKVNREIILSPDP